MTRDQVELFGISSVADYLKLCGQSVDELEADQASVLRGFTAVLLLNHIPSWLQHKLSSDERSVLGMSDTRAGQPVNELFHGKTGDLDLVRSIANGFKHLQPVNLTERIVGYGKGPFGIGPFGKPYLLINLGDDLPANRRWETGLGLCRRVLDWWQKRLMTAPGRSEARS